MAHNSGGDTRSQAIVVIRFQTVLYLSGPQQLFGGGGRRLVSTSLREKDGRAADNICFIVAEVAEWR